MPLASFLAHTRPQLLNLSPAMGHPSAYPPGPPRELRLGLARSARPCPAAALHVEVIPFPHPKLKPEAANVGEPRSQALAQLSLPVTGPSEADQLTGPGAFLRARRCLTQGSSDCAQAHRPAQAQPPSSAIEFKIIKSFDSDSRSPNPFIPPTPRLRLSRYCVPTGLGRTRRGCFFIIIFS